MSKKEASLRASSGPDGMNPDAMAQMLWGFPFWESPGEFSSGSTSSSNYMIF